VNLAIYLAPRSEDSRVVIDGNDISDSVRGIEVRAYAQRQTEIRLLLTGRVEVTGETLRLFVNHEGGKETRMATPEQLPTEPAEPVEPNTPETPGKPKPGTPRPDVGRPGERPDVGAPGRPGERPEPRR
jgi:hypothetical protein